MWTGNSIGRHGIDSDANSDGHHGPQLPRASAKGCWSEGRAIVLRVYPWTTLGFWTAVVLYLVKR